MSKKKKPLVLRKGRRNKKASKGKEKKSNVIANAVTSQKQNNDLRLKFKLKELRIILHDIAADNAILPNRKPFVNKNMGSSKVINKCKEYTNKKISSKDKKSSIKDIVNTKCSNVTSSAIATGKHDTYEKITEKQNIDKIQTTLLNAEGQKTCIRGHTEYHSFYDSKGEKKKKKRRATNDIGYTLKSENTDLPIAAKNSNRNQCLDLFNEATLLPDENTENEAKKQNISFNEQNGETYITNKDLIKDEHSFVQTDDGSPKATQKILINQEGTNRVYNENSLKERDLPKITECRILSKNAILLKAQDNMQIASNVQDTACYTDVALQNKSNECLSIEKHSTVVELTEDNLYKFTVHYNKCPVSEENVMSLHKTENLQSSANSNSTEITFRMNKDDLHVPHRKRGWITQKTAAELDKTCIKRIKLNRKCIQEKICTTKSSFECLSDDKNIDFFSKCHSKNVNNDRVQDMNDHLTLYSINGNSSCTIKLASESNKNDFDDTPRSTHVVEKNICSSPHTIFNGESEKNELLLIEQYHQNIENIVENNLNENKVLSCSTQLDPQKQVKSKINDNHDDIECNNDGGNDDNQKTGGNDIECDNNGGNDDNQKTGGDDDNRRTGGVDDNRKTVCDDYNRKNGGDDGNCNNHDDDNDDDDCISLFTDSFVSEDPMVVPSNEKKEKSTCHDYKMSGTIFNNYLQQNIVECNKELDSIAENDTLQDKSFQKSYEAKYEEIKQSSIPVLEKLPIRVESISSTSPPVINNNNSSCPDKNYNKSEENVCYDETVMTCTKQMALIDCRVLCRGYCFAKMRNGDCSRTKCHFNHNLQTLIRNITFKYKQYLTSIMLYVYSSKYHYFLRGLYIQSVHECNLACILVLYETLYSMKYANVELVCITIKELLDKGMHPKDVVDSLCKFVNSTDTWTPQCILNSIKDKIAVGEYWDSLRSLLIYTKPSQEVIESILNECVITRKNIQDVHINLIQKLQPIEINLLNEDLMLSFNNLLKHEYQKVPDKTSPKLVSVSNKNVESPKESYVLQPISDLPETHSQYRDRFWKIYLMIYNIKEALIHEDYDYVISILSEYEETNEDESLFSRCCFHMLTAEIKHSEYHISKIIEHAVQIGASSILYKVLLDVATYILLKLITENAWTLAYKLLKTLHIYNLQHNAAFIILSAEIYLANKHAIKALMLIKQSNIISTNRDNWNVESNAQDYYPRTNLIGILLDVLCIKSPEHAFFIFQFLTKDQGNNFRPIDLTNYVDKLMLKLLIEREIDLIIKMGYMMIEYNFSFFNITICRAAIASIVHIDMVLAKQLYQYASGLGIYRIIELLPVIHVIINVDWVEEEIYLTFWDLFQRLVMDIGHSIDHLNPAQLSIYIIFETVPTEAHLYCENLDDEQKKKVQISKNLVRQVLRTRFEPSILLSKKAVNGAIKKLQSKVVINHLKEIYKNYNE